MSFYLLIILLVVFTCSYVTYFGLIAKPEWSIYSYLLIWMIVPKAFRLYYLTGGASDLPDGLTVFHILEAIAICAIAVAMMKHRRSRRPIEGAGILKRFTWLFWITGAV